MKNKKCIKRTLASIVLLISVLTVTGCNQKDIGSDPIAGEIITSGVVQESPVAASSSEPAISVNQTTAETPESANEISVMFINVGRADATLIQIFMH